MKDIIKKLLKETLDELSTKDKPLFGSGMYHRVFSTNKNPNVLYKVGSKNVVQNWVNIFKRYPQYFPKIYRVFPLKKDPRYWSVEIEKMDTKQAEMDLKRMDDFLYSNANNFECDGEFISIHNFFKTECFQVLKEHINDKELLNLFEKWGKFLSEAYPIIEDELNDYPDIHSGNVAYTESGDIKFIDI